MVGDTLGRYRILAELGRGGMGVVYRARDERLERDIALKVLSPALVADPQFKQRLLQEARAAAALVHPGVAAVHEIDEIEGVAFIAMELVPGQALSAVLKLGALPLDRALDVARQVAQVLAAGHARGIVHRDVKPGNVMLTESGVAKLIDFGLAKSIAPPVPIDSEGVTPARGGTDPGRLIGTAAYMSPEQARGKPADLRSDVFAFGALLFELLTGQPAFLRDNPIETLHAVIKEPAPALPFDDQDLERILGRCLAKLPAERYADARPLAEDLDRMLAGAGLEATAAQPRAQSALRVLIVDDEEPARAVLREYLLAYADVEVVGECANGFEAVKAVAELKPELLFLDVQMPKLDGFEVLELVGGEVAVVFVTAFDEHALRAFEVNAVDYLLKPTSAERVSQALERVRRRVAAGERPSVAALLAEVRPKDRPLDRVLVRQGPRVHVIPAAELEFAEAQDDYVSLRAGGRSHLKQQTMADLERELDPQRFVRIHRRYLMNVGYLDRLESDGDARLAILKDGTRLPVSRTGLKRLRTQL